jgi:hypothetical protein
MVATAPCVGRCLDPKPSIRSNGGSGGPGLTSAEDRDPEASEEPVRATSGPRRRSKAIGAAFPVEAVGDVHTACAMAISGSTRHWHEPVCRRRSPRTRPDRAPGPRTHCCLARNERYRAKPIVDAIVRPRANPAVALPDCRDAETRSRLEQSLRGSGRPAPRPRTACALVRGRARLVARRGPRSIAGAERWVRSRR